MKEPAGDDAETSVDSLHDDLTAAFESVGTETSADTDKAAPAADATAQSADKGPTASGEANKAPVETAVEPPKHWSDSDKQLFTRAPKDLQQRWISREAEQQKGVDAKFQEIAGYRREKEAFDEVFGPLNRDLELNGISRVDFTRRMLGIHNVLRDDPKQAFRWLAEQYGYDLSTLNEQEQSVNPQFAELMKKTQNLERQLSGFATQQQQADHQANLGKVESFANEKDEKGTPLRPYFDEVAADILVLVKNGTKDLTAAYNKAVRMNDAVWAKVQADQKLADTKAAATERILEINKAKRAGKTSEVVEAKAGNSRPTTLKEDLNAGFAAWEG